MKYDIEVVENEGVFRAVIKRLHEFLYRSEPHATGEAARQDAERWLHWFVSVPNGTVESVYYILEVPETWPGPPRKAHPYSGLRVKIGTTKNVKARLSQLQTGSSAKLIIHALEPGDLKVEASRHEQFASDRRSGEWFACSPALAKHMADTWYLNRALPPDHQETVMTLLERIKILRAVRETLGGAPDMINPSLNEPWHGSIFLDLVNALPVDPE